MQLATFLPFLLVAAVCTEHLNLKVVVSEPNITIKISCKNGSIVIETSMETVAEESFLPLLQSLFEGLIFATLLYYCSFWNVLRDSFGPVIDRILSLNMEAFKPQRKIGRVDVTHLTTEQGRYVILRTLNTPVETVGGYETSDEVEDQESTKYNSTEESDHYYYDDELGTSAM